jgi:glycosyltransferase involved in cell wall biosynthesis
VTSLPPTKGISFYAVPLLEALSQRPDLDVDAIAFRRLYPARLYPGGSAFDFSAQPAAVANIRWTLDALNPLSWLKAALQIRGKVVHAQWWSQMLAPAYVALLAVSRLRRKTVVLTIHNTSPHEPALWKALADKAVMALADHYIVHAAENAEALARQTSRARGRTSVIPMGPQPGVTSGLTRAEARSRLGLASRQKVLLFFGNLRPYKRLDVMLEAFELLRERLPKSRLLVVGQPWSGSPQVARDVAKARLQPNVTLRTEYVSEAETEAYFAAADLVVYPYSGFESQSAAASKAVAHGKALLVSRTGGLVNFVRDQRAIVPPGDAVALAAAAETILSNPRLRRKLEQDSRRVAESFSWERIAEETAGLYLQLAGRQSSRGLATAQVEKKAA